MIRRLVCRLFGHAPLRYAARKNGYHLAGMLCRRCHRILVVRKGSRQERRRIMRERAAA